MQSACDQVVVSGGQRADRQTDGFSVDQKTAQRYVEKENPGRFCRLHQ